MFLSLTAYKKKPYHLRKYQNQTILTVFDWKNLVFAIGLAVSSTLKNLEPIAARVPHGRTESFFFQPANEARFSVARIIKPVARAKVVSPYQVGGGNDSRFDFSNFSQDLLPYQRDMEGKPYWNFFFVFSPVFFWKRKHIGISLRLALDRWTYWNIFRYNPIFLQIKE